MTKGRTVREQILHAAQEALRDGGGDALRLHDIADRAGIARPHLYRYFDSKADLLREAVLAEIRRIHDQRRRALKRVRTGEELIVESLVLGAHQARAAHSVIAIAGPEMKGVGQLVAHDTDLVAVEAEYWTPVIAQARRECVIDPVLDDYRIIKWFLTSQFLVVTQPDLVGPDLREWVERFIVPPIRMKFDVDPRPHAP
ncbi:TetR/AcrR family transcriptional regulator [Nocardia sp. AB354]|uniref:TetR/AcrR family transcriptional regulator n=1 Tax=Nocardia sp. AB354 TaxID=3413283 RepID=UPI003C141C7B